MKTKKFDVVDAILQIYDQREYSKPLQQIVKERDIAVDNLLAKLNYPQEKLYMTLEEKQTALLIAHEKEVAYFVYECLISILFKQE